MRGHCARMLEISQNVLAGKDGALMLSSAARLITAGADAALAQLRLSLGETRHRSFVQRSRELNPKFSPSPQEDYEAIRTEIERRIERIAANIKTARDDARDDVQAA
jgi:hypothetical protein